MKIKRLCNTKKGFSLIEVIIALAILMIVVLGLLTSYYSYYRNMVDLRIQTTGQNLAQLQLEDIQNLPVSVLNIIVGETDEFGPGLGIYLPNYPEDTDSDETIYDSGDGTPGRLLMNGSFKIEHLTDICGETTGDLPDLLLPTSVGIEQILDPPDTGVFIDYTLTLHKEVFPNYKKRIVITDNTLGLTDAQKIFTIEVTVYWGKDADGDGIPDKHITVTGEKNDARIG